MPRINGRSERLFALFCGCSMITAQVNAYTLKTFGNVGQIALPITALLTTITYHDRPGAIQFVKAYGTTMGTTFLLKPTINRTRPDGGEWSFPSGHSASAFASAAFLHRRYGLAFGMPTYLVAGTVGYSRIAAKRHYTSDVLAGAALGIGANYIFTTHLQSASVMPFFCNDQIGLQAHVSW